MILSGWKKSWLCAQVQKHWAPKPEWYSVPLGFLWALRWATWWCPRWPTFSVSGGCYWSLWPLPVSSTSLCGGEAIDAANLHTRKAKTKRKISVIFKMFRILPESPRWLVSQGRVKDAEIILRAAAKAGNIDVPKNIFTKAEVTFLSNPNLMHKVILFLGFKNVSNYLQILTQIVTVMVSFLLIWL